MFFPGSYYARTFSQGARMEMLDTGGHRIQLKRNSVRSLEELIFPSGHTIEFSHDSADRIVEARDDRGDVRRYSYDRSGHLDSVSNGSKVLYRFECQRAARTMIPTFSPRAEACDQMISGRARFGSC